MKPCPACGRHHREPSVCPHCGAAPAGRTAAAVLLGLGLVTMPACVSMYGIEVTDRKGECCDSADTAAHDGDNDGWDARKDCDDADPAIHPEAVETPGDGVDSNCDENDDT